jgi:hypothetical protein
MKVWIVKYVCSGGISSEDLDIDENGYASGGRHGCWFFLRKSEYDTDLSRAKEKALTLVAKKRLSIAKQIKKLDKIQTEIKKMEEPDVDSTL